MGRSIRTTKDGRSAATPAGQASEWEAAWEGTGMAKGGEKGMQHPPRHLPV